MLKFSGMIILATSNGEQFLGQTVMCQFTKM